MTTKGVLFLCVANSARSQMAEGLARVRYGARARILSAGSKPSRVNPFAIAAMSELEIDLSSHASTAADDVDASEVDLVITLCQEEVCPVFLGDAERHHWPFEDPDKKDASLTDDENLANFRRVRDLIAKKLDELDALL